MNLYGRYGNYIPKGIKHIVEKIPVAKCDRKYDKGDTIIVETHRDRYETVWSYLGEENGKPLYGMKKKRLEHHCCTVWNYLGEKNGEYLYSITRTNYKKKDTDYINRAINTMIPIFTPPMVEAYRGERQEKRLSFKQRVETMRKNGAFITLSMPESIEYYKKKLHEETILYEGMKNGRITHLDSALGNFFKIDDFSMYWAKRMQKELTEKYRLAKKLWGADFVNNDSSHYLISPEGDQRESFSEFLASNQGLPKKQQEKTPA